MRDAGRGPGSGLALLPGQGERLVSSQLEQVTGEWRQKLGPVSITLPPSAARYTQTLRTQLADILINRDGPAIQPGSRSYSRSWIRDGSLTSTALLRLGHDRDVKDFIDWYAGYQYDNGKIPCCVDTRGADRVCAQSLFERGVRRREDGAADGDCDEHLVQQHTRSVERRARRRASGCSPGRGPPARRRAPASRP